MSIAVTSIFFRGRPCIKVTADFLKTITSFANFSHILGLSLRIDSIFGCCARLFCNAHSFIYFIICVDTETQYVIDDNNMINMSSNDISSLPAFQICNLSVIITFDWLLFMPAMVQVIESMKESIQTIV